MTQLTRNRNMTYHHGKLDATPNEGSDIRVRLHKGIHDIAEVGERQQDIVQSTGKALAGPLLASMVKLCGENHHGIDIRYAMELHEVATLLFTQDPPEIVHSIT